MIRTEHLRFLLGRKTRDQYHSNRSLLDHLIGTHNLLCKWENPDEVNVAGLFHSIYGIKTRNSRPDRFNLRGQLQGLIGDASEHLVYLFCSLDRGSYLQPDAAQLEAWEHKALVEIEAANIIEQWPYIERYFSDTLSYIVKLHDVRHLLSPGGRDALEGFIASLSQSNS